MLMTAFMAMNAVDWMVMNTADWVVMNIILAERVVARVALGLIAFGLADGIRYVTLLFRYSGAFQPDPTPNRIDRSYQLAQFGV